jgi:hypothetical protein
MRKLYSLLIMMVGLAVAGFAAGMVWMTHMHHRGQQYVEAGRLVAFDHGYETLTDQVAVPLAAASFGLALAMNVLRHPLVPWWLPLTAAALQVTAWLARTVMWGDWADQVRQAGGVRQADGTLHPAYVQYMDSHWMRIGLLTVYVLLVLTMLVVVAVRQSRRSAPPDRHGSPLPA